MQHNVATTHRVHRWVPFQARWAVVLNANSYACLMKSFCDSSRVFQTHRLTSFDRGLGLQVVTSGTPLADVVRGLGTTAAR